MAKIKPEGRTYIAGRIIDNNNAQTGTDVFHTCRRVSTHATSWKYPGTCLDDHDHHAIEYNERRDVPPIGNLWVVAHEFGMNVILLHAYLLNALP